MSGVVAKESGGMKVNDHHLNTPKRVLFDWEQDIGTKGNLMYLKKTDIKVPDEYQRELNNKKALQIAAHFRWDAFGALTVALRRNGYFVIEGQHRLAAAMKRDDVDLVPCVVFVKEEIKAEASAFLLQNTNRKPLTFYDRFKALEVNSDATAEFIIGLLDETGHKLGTAHNRQGIKVVRCTALMYRWASTKPDALYNAWPLIAAVHGERTVGEQITEGLCYMEDKIPGVTSDKRWRKRILDAGYDRLTNSIIAAKAFFTKGGAKVYATGIVKEINKGLPENRRLILPGSEGVA